MKKRLLVLLLTAALVLSMASGIQASGTICFVAMNDTIPLTLTGGEAPYYSGSKLYIPYTSFNISPNGVGATYNSEKNTFVLFNKDQTLIFDLKEDSYTDNKGNSYNVDIVFRGGMLYAPADVMRHFGVSVTLLTSRAGFLIIRFTNGEQVYDDGMFVAQAENLITRAAEEHQSQSVYESADPDDTTQTPEEEPPEETGPVNVYMAFAGAAITEDTLRVLRDMELRSAFFFTEAQILEQRDLVRAVYAAGHTIGITAEPGETDLSAALQRANDALDTVLFCRSVYVLLPADAVLETTAYHVLREPVGKTVDTILQEPEEVNLCVIRENGGAVISAFAEAGAVLLRLRETTF